MENEEAPKGREQGNITWLEAEYMAKRYAWETVKPFLIMVLSPVCGFLVALLIALLLRAN